MSKQILKSSHIETKMHLQTTRLYGLTLFFSTIPPYSLVYCHVLQVSTNYRGFPLCAEYMYQPYMEHQ